MIKTITLARDSRTNRYEIFVNEEQSPALVVYSEKKANGNYRILIANFADGQIRNPAGRGEACESDLAARLLECARIHADRLSKLMPGKARFVDKTIQPQNF